MFDKEKEFVMIEEMLNEVRIACNRMQIPFIWIAAIKDDGNNTAYKAVADENEITNLDVTKYPCHALVPGSMGINLQDDKIRDIIKVLNGFKVGAKDSAITIAPEDLSHLNLFPDKNNIYQFDELEGGFIMCEEQRVTDTKDDNEDRKETMIVLRIQPANVLAHIGEDFEED